MKIEELRAMLAKVEDPRRTNKGNIRHKLEDIIIIGLCSLICNGNDFSDMEDFGEARQTWLKQFFELPNGIPDSDTFRRVFERLKPDALAECLYAWLGQHRPEGSVVAIDGKTICGSKNANHRAYHVVSAFVAENQLTLGEITTDEKSNEITAVPELLDMIDVQGSIVTADAMSCQRDIVQKICAKEADYVIALKHWAIENQLHWCLDVIFREDDSRARKDFSPLNLNILRKTALALCKSADFGKRVSLQKRRYRASLDPDAFLRILWGKF